MSQAATSMRNHCLSPARAGTPIDAPIGPANYARMLPELPSFEADKEFLHALGRVGGLCDCGDLEDSALIVNKKTVKRKSYKTGAKRLHARERKFHRKITEVRSLACGRFAPVLYPFSKPNCVVTFSQSLYPEVVLTCCHDDLVINPDYFSFT